MNFSEGGRGCVVFEIIQRFEIFQNEKFSKVKEKSTQKRSYSFFPLGPVISGMSSETA